MCPPPTFPAPATLRAKIKLQPQHKRLITIAIAETQIKPEYRHFIPNIVINYINHLLYILYYLFQKYNLSTETINGAEFTTSFYRTVLVHVSGSGGGEPTCAHAPTAPHSFQLCGLYFNRYQYGIKSRCTTLSTGRLPLQNEITCNIIWYKLTNNNTKFK